MQIPNLTLRYQILAIKPALENAHINKIQELPNGWIKFKVRGSLGAKDLVAAPDMLYITQHKLSAKQTTSGYAAFLRKKLQNKKIISFSQHGFDRVAVMEFSEFLLIFELFAKGNVVFTDKEHTILSAYRKEIWKDRTLKKTHAYKFPASKGANPSEVTLPELKEILSADTALAAALVKKINIAPVIAEEICIDAKIDKKTESNSLSEAQVKKILSALQNYYSKIAPSKLKPVLAEKDGKKILLPFKLSSVQVLQEFDSLDSAFDELLSGEISSKQETAAKSRFERELKGLEYSLLQQREAQDKFEAQVVEYRKKAEMIYANHGEISRLTRALNSVKEKTVSEETIQKLKKEFPILFEFNSKKKKIVVNLGARE